MKQYRQMPDIRRSSLLIISAVAPMLVSAQPGPDSQGRVAAMPAMQATGATRCVTGAASFHAVNPWILKAILKVESGFRADVVNRNRNGTVDVGMAQINSMHFKELSRHGIAPSDLMDACVATYVAAWHLAKQYRAHGNTWFAVGAYHSTTPCFNRRYSGLVWNTLLMWGVVDGPRLKVQSLADCGYVAPAPTRAAKSSRPASKSQIPTSAATMLAYDESN